MQGIHGVCREVGKRYCKIANPTGSFQGASMTVFLPGEHGHGMCKGVAVAKFPQGCARGLPPSPAEDEILHLLPQGT